MEAARNVGLRGLKEHTGKIVRGVDATDQLVNITNHGRTIARLVPARDEGAQLTPEEWMAKMEAFSAKLSEGWPADVSAVEAVREQRRSV